MTTLPTMMLCKPVTPRLCPIGEDALLPVEPLDLGCDTKKKQKVPFTKGCDIKRSGIFARPLKTCAGTSAKTQIYPCATYWCCPQCRSWLQVEHLKQHVRKAAVTKNVLVFAKVQIHGQGIALLLAIHRIHWILLIFDFLERYMHMCALPLVARLVAYGYTRKYVVETHTHTCVYIYICIYLFLYTYISHYVCIPNCIYIQIFISIYLPKFK